MSANANGNSVIVSGIKSKENTFSITFDNGDKIEIGIDTYTEFHLYVGKEIAWEEYERFLSFARQDEAYRLALKRLGHDLYTRREMREYLLGKGQDPDVVEKVINRLVEADLINDARYAQTFAEDVADLRLIGRNQIVFVLRGKGIPPSILEKIDIPREKELDKALRFARVADKKYQKTPRSKRIQKVAYALLRRGFDDGVAFEAAETCAAEDNPETVQSELNKALNLAIVKYSRKYKGYELRQHVFAYLARRGYDYDDIKHACEEANI